MRHGSGKGGGARGGREGNLRGQKVELGGSGRRSSNDGGVRV